MPLRIELHTCDAKHADAPQRPGSAPGCGFGSARRTSAQATSGMVNQARISHAHRVPETVASSAHRRQALQVPNASRVPYVGHLASRQTTGWRLASAIKSRRFEPHKEFGMRLPDLSQTPPGHARNAPAASRAGPTRRLNIWPWRSIRNSLHFARIPGSSRVFDSAAAVIEEIRVR